MKGTCPGTKGGNAIGPGDWFWGIYGTIYWIIGCGGGAGGGIWGIYCGSKGKFSMGC